MHRAHADMLRISEGMGDKSSQNLRGLPRLRRRSQFATRVKLAKGRQ